MSTLSFPNYSVIFFIYPIKLTANLDIYYSHILLMYTANLVIICETAFIYFVVFLLYKLDFNRMYHEQEVNGSTVPVFHTDDFILKVTVAKISEKLPENTKKLPENTKKLPESSEKLPENYQGIIDRIIKKANSNGEKLKENKIAILRLIAEDPYISKTDIANTLGISYTAVGSNIKAMRGKYLRRVGPDKGGFWEIIE